MISAAEIAARPALLVRDLAQARAALRVAREAGRAVAVWSPPGAAAYWGAGYFAALAEEATAAEPGADAAFVLDCGEDAGAAMAALRAGVRALCYTGGAEVRARLADMAAQVGAALLDARPEAADLGASDAPLEVARRVLDRSR